MGVRRLPAAVLAAAADRRGGATEVAATALDGLLEVAGDPALLEQAVAVLLAGQPAMAPMWHLARAASAPDPPSALAELRHRLDADTDAAVAAAAGWLRHHLSERPGAVATVSHSSLVDRVLANLQPSPRGPHPYPGRSRPTVRGPRSNPGGSRPDPRWGSVPDRHVAGPRLSTGDPRGEDAADPVVGAVGAADPVVGVVGADAIGPEAVLNAAGTRALAGRLPTLVVATAIKLVPAEPFRRLAGPGFETVPLGAVAAVVIGPEVLSPADAGRRAQAQ